MSAIGIHDWCPVCGGSPDDHAPDCVANDEIQRPDDVCAHGARADEPCDSCNARHHGP